MAQKVAKVGIKKQPGYLYFIDGKGDISRVKMARGGKKKKGKKKIAKKSASKAKGKSKSKAKSKAKKKKKR